MDTSAPKSQKPVLAGLIAFGALAIALGALNLKRLIGPARVAPNANVPAIPSTREEFEQQQRAVLEALDTDRDGINDLTELEWTKTSPFLADSDSDGKTDKEEVDAGEDPNCPKGKTCGPAVQPEAVVRPTIPPLELPGAPNLGQPPETPPVGGVGGAGDLKALRASLERQGIPAAILDQLTDEQLTTSYGAMLGAISASPTGEPLPFADALRGAFSGALSGGAGGSLAGALDALPQTPSAIRAVLLKSGFPQDQLKKLDDKTLLEFWKQAIDDAKQQQAVIP